MFQRTGRPKFNQNNINNNFTKFNQSNNNFNNRSTFVKNKFGTRFIRKTNLNQSTIKHQKPNRDAMIAKNLEHMKQVSFKKKVAQEKYYGRNNNNGRSPIIKGNPDVHIKQEKSRVSVQQRLGNVNRNQKFVSVRQQFQNTRKSRNTQFTGGVRNDKIIRVQNFQQKKGLSQNKKYFNSRSGIIKTINSTGKIIYLKPVRNPRKPTNLSVRVDNNRKHLVQQNLNPLLQQEIKMIQAKAAPMRQVMGPQIVMDSIQMPYHNNIERLPIVATKTTLHERFSNI